MNQEFLQEYHTFLGEEYNGYFSPGRINIIGEHIDYLGGNVFPTAISLGTYAYVSKRNDQELHLVSDNFKDFGETIISLKDLEYKEEHKWANFVKGMFKKYIDKGYNINTGLNILIHGTLPRSSGLSSSASLEVLIGTVIKHEYNLNLSNLEIVLDSKDVENNYIGVNCGIMDQFAIGMAEDKKAIYLNTNTLEYQQIPLDLGEYTLLIANTNKKRTLSEGVYNQRVEECQNALKKIQDKGINITNLCELSESQVKEMKSYLTQTEYKRVTHAVTENTRTIQSIEALLQNDIVSLGKHLYDSHASLKDLYEVSCIELDTLVDSFQQQGAIGARMTGAGFGGCAIALVQKDKASQISKKVEQDYFNKIGYNTEIYQVTQSGGPRKIEVK